MDVDELECLIVVTGILDAVLFEVKVGMMGVILVLLDVIEALDVIKVPDVIEVLKVLEVLEILEMLEMLEVELIDVGWGMQSGTTVEAPW